MKLPNITVNGTWEIKCIAKILLEYKNGGIELSDAVWQLMLEAK